MSEPTPVVLCADRQVLPGLHVAAYSILTSHQDTASIIEFHLLTDALTRADCNLLKQTLDGAGKPYRLELHKITAANFSRFPSMDGSWGAYFRLLAPDLLSADRFIYLDVDILCSLDVTNLLAVDLAGRCAGFVAETTIQAGPDLSVKDRLPPETNGHYFNSGVMVVDRQRWVEGKVTEQCFEFLRSGSAIYHDQSALNYVLRDYWQPLDKRFNFICNQRSNWPAIKNNCIQGKILHLLDNPKPWDWLGEWFHPQYQIWRAVLNQTAVKNYRSWHNTPALKFLCSRKVLTGYKKAIKDRLLFSGYSRGWLKQVKGTPAMATCQD